MRHLSLIVGAALFTLLSSCSFSTPEGRFACSSDDECPRNWVCSNSRCWRAQTDAGASNDAVVDATIDAAVVDTDLDGTPDTTDCAPSDPGIAATHTRACANDCGAGTESCTMGTWSACDAPTSCCAAGQTQTIPCGRCGTQSQRCESNHWVDEGVCTDEGACEPGASESGGSCGSCGTQQRTCLSTCEWDAWACEAEGCMPGATETDEEACASCGETRKRTRTCTNACAWDDWGAWGSCEGGSPNSCDPSRSSMQTSSMKCGPCDSGWQVLVRTCQSDCLYGDWMPSGECSVPAHRCEPTTVDVESAACGNCNTGTQTRSRTCRQDCYWNAFGDYSACGDVSGCAPTTSESTTRSCAGGCGTGTQSATRTCSNTCAWGDWTPTTACTGCAGIGESRTVSCCGTGTGAERRYCGITTCEWSPWAPGPSDTCSVGECRPGHVDGCHFELCSDPSQSQSRSCTDQCTWGEWGVCDYSC